MVGFGRIHLNASLVARVHDHAVYKLGVSQLTPAEEKIIGQEGNTSVGGVLDELALELVESTDQGGGGASDELND